VNLAERVRRALGKRKGLAEKKMFGGLAFMLDNRMCCGVINNDLVVRVGPDQYESALAQPHARRLDFTGRPLKGFVYVGVRGYSMDRALASWIKQALNFVEKLPAKSGDINPQRRKRRK
jgi:TfoX/Sxy family transcriptional regulator of competence genes